MSRRNRPPRNVPDHDRRMPHETMGQWRARLAIGRQMARTAGEPLIPIEAERHGQYAEDYITHVETNTKAWTKRRKSSSSLIRMYESGSITPEQFSAATRITFIAERVGNDVGCRGSNVNARVDNTGSGRDMLIEHIGHVRDEMTYTEWRQRLPMPRRLVLDMLLLPQSMVATARSYGLGWLAARERLTSSLDVWIKIRERIAKEVDEEDVARAASRLLTSNNGSGTF